MPHFANQGEEMWGKWVTKMSYVSSSFGVRDKL
jgi:hypothetical protein